MILTDISVVMTDISVVITDISVDTDRYIHRYLQHIFVRGRNITSEILSVLQKNAKMGYSAQIALVYFLYKRIAKAICALSTGIDQIKLKG